VNVDLEPSDARELKEEFYDLFTQWVERVTPTFKEPSASLTYDGKGVYLAITEEDDYWAMVPWDEFEDEILNTDDEVIKMYLPKFQELVRKMQEVVEEAQ